MKYPNLNEEKKLWKEGYMNVAGIDEAGRGPLAGPVVASAVLVSNFPIKDYKIFSKINDSKKISEKQREHFYNLLTSHQDIKWGIGIISEKVIDKINILQATKLAMNTAVYDLEKKLKKKADFLILDGNFYINSKTKQKAIIKADQKVFSCVAAGIIAKVTRDRMMKEFDVQYPEYGFVKHKGYGTKLHIQNIKKYGACKIHRKTFYPVSSI